MAVYGQPQMLRFNLAAIHGYSQEVRDQLKVIVVDDCGDPPVTPGSVAGFSFDLSVYRITENKPWNQPMARNLGMHHAAPSWCLMIDPDMVFRPEMMQKVIGLIPKLARRSVLRYGLKHVSDPGRSVDLTSPNTYIIHREDFFAVGGYDEDFSGHKGWSDVQLLDVLRSTFKVSQRKDIYADFYSTKNIPDAAVHTLDRSTSHNKKLRLKKVDQSRKAGSWARWAKHKKGSILRLPWTQVYPTT